MNDFLETESVRLMAGNMLTVTNEEMQNAYLQFTEQVEGIDTSEIGFSANFRLLNVTRIELAAFGTLHQYKAGEKCA